ncbi:MAG: ATP synthase F1 subunit delta [Bacteroidales bacterium]|nr:ATP synthase F1 subunit delta [Bacteroidales bacterium]
MNSGRVAIRYAKALLMLGNNKGISPLLYDHTKTLIQLIQSSDSLVDLMRNPSIRLADKLSAINRALSGSICEELIQFLNLLIKRNRFEYAFNSLLLFRDLYRAENGILDVQIETALELSTVELQGIESFIKSKYSKSIELSVVLKPQLVGGYVVIVEGKILDYSVAGQLSQIKKSMGLSFSN